MRKKHFEIVVERLRSLMTDAGLDAVIAFTNENITYINTISPIFINDSGWLGTAMIVVPRKGEVVGICSDFERPALESEGTVPTWNDFHMWIYIDDQFIKSSGREGKNASQSFENDMSMTVLAECLREKCIDHGKIGIEKKALQVPIWEDLKKTLPNANFSDSGPLFYNARYIKTPYEIECLRHAAESQETILFETMGEIGLGISHADILRKLRSKALGTLGIDKIRFMFVGIGKIYAPCSVPYQINVAHGDLIKFDGALVVRGYGGDCGRTFIAGKPSADQERIHRILLSGHEEALKLIRPGVKPKDVFEKAMKTVQDNGLPNYNRGHVGHSVGLDQTVEEPPFISSYSENPIVPGNVFCLELPYYAYGFGSIQFEDMVLVTEDGHELLTKSSKLLNPIGG